MVWSNNSKDYTWTPCGRRTGPAPESQIFFISCGIRTGPVRTRKRAVRRSYGHVRELTPPEFAKIPHGRRMWPYGARTGPARIVHGLFIISKPYWARKLIMHALKLYGPRTGRQNSYGAAREPYGPREWTYDFCSNSQWTTRTGPGSVMWLGQQAGSCDHWCFHGTCCLTGLNSYNVTSGSAICNNVTSSSVMQVWKHGFTNLVSNVMTKMILLII